MKWLLKFKRKDAPEGEGCVCTVVRPRFAEGELREEDLQGEKESMCMELEKNSGEAWVCIDAVTLKSREDRHDD